MGWAKLIILPFLISSIIACTKNEVPNVKGLVVGETGYDQMVELIGNPNDTRTIGHSIRHEYKDIVVTFKKSRDVINTIIVNDTTLSDLHGIKIGMTKAEVESRLGDLSEKGESISGTIYDRFSVRSEYIHHEYMSKHYIHDGLTGILYIFEYDILTQVVYGSPKIHQLTKVSN